MLIEALTYPLTKARTANSTATSFASKVATATEPTGTGVISLTAGAHPVGAKGVCLIPYGTGDDNDVFAMRVIAWREVGADDPGTSLWIPCVLAELTCTLSAAVGVADKVILDTERFCDTIVKVTGNDNYLHITSPTGDVIGHALVLTNGAQKVELTFDATTGDPTGMNCLYALI